MKLAMRLLVGILLMAPAVGFSQDPNLPDAEGTVTAASPNGGEEFDTNDDITLHGAGKIKNNEPVLWIKGKVELELQERVQINADTFQYQTIPFPEQAGTPGGCTCCSEVLIDVGEEETVGKCAEIGKLPKGHYRVRVRLMAKFNVDQSPNPGPVTSLWRFIGQPGYGYFSVEQAQGPGDEDPPVDPPNPPGNNN